MKLQLSKDLWIEIFSKQESKVNPFSNFMEGGVSFPGRHIYGMFNLTEISSNKFDGIIDFKWTEKQKMHTTFTVSKSGKFTGYVFNSLTNITNMNEIQIAGSVKLDIKRKSTSIDITFDGKEKLGDALYNGRIFFQKNETYQSVYVNIKSMQQIYLSIEIQKDSQSVEIDFMWDKEQNPNKRVYFKLCTQQVLKFEVIILDFITKLNIIPENTSIHFIIGIGDKQLDIESKFKVTYETVNVLFTFKSSFKSTTKLKAHIFSLLSEEDGQKKFNTSVSFFFNIFSLVLNFTILFQVIFELNNDYLRLRGLGNFGNLLEVKLSSESSMYQYDAFQLGKLFI